MRSGSAARGRTGRVGCRPGSAYVGWHPVPNGSVGQEAQGRPGLASAG